MILLVGYGYWGKNLARNFKKELVAICETKSALLKQASELYPHVTLYTDLDEALADDRVQAVAIATKANTHHDIAIKCLEYKKHLWIEKPVCRNIKEIDDLIATSEKADRQIFVDHTFCYNPAVQHMKTVDIGKPLYYNSVRISIGLFQADVDVILDLAIHDLSIINYLYPDLELRDVVIAKNNHINNVANQALINLQFTNNFTASINCNWVSPIKKREIILTGDQKSIVYDDMDINKLKIYSTGSIDESYNTTQLGDMMSPKISELESLHYAKMHFVDCVKNNTRPITNIYQARKVMRWVM